MSCIDWYICINLNYIHPKVHILFICYLTSLKYGAEQKCPLLSSYSIKTKQFYNVRGPYLFYLSPCFRHPSSVNEVNLFLVCVRLKKEKEKSYWFTDTAFHQYCAYYPTASENLEGKKIYRKSKIEVYLHISRCAAQIFARPLFASSLGKYLPTPWPLLQTRPDISSIPRRASSSHTLSAELIPAFPLAPLEDALIGEWLGASWERGRAFRTVSPPLLAMGSPCYLAGQEGPCSNIHRQNPFCSSLFAYISSLTLSCSRALRHGLVVTGYNLYPAEIKLTLAVFASKGYTSEVNQFRDFCLRLPT